MKRALVCGAGGFIGGHLVKRACPATSSPPRCIYRDMEPDEPPLTEDDAIPANPDNEYGWEKLYAERVAMAYGRRYPMKVRIARFENCYGPEGTWTGGREKAPAAICRKVAEAEDDELRIADFEFRIGKG